MDRSWITSALIFAPPFLLCLAQRALTLPTISSQMLQGHAEDLFHYSKYLHYHAFEGRFIIFRMHYVIFFFDLLFNFHGIGISCTCTSLHHTVCTFYYHWHFHVLY